MPVAIIPDEGMALCLSKIEQSLKVRLYTDAVTIDKDSVYADLATEASFPGYAEATVSWGTITVDGVTFIAENVATAITFERTSTGSPQTVKVWALVDPVNHVIIAARNPGDQVFTNAGDKFVLTLSGFLGDL